MTVFVPASALVPPPAGHNPASAAFDDAVLRRIAAVRRSNGEALAVRQEGRTRCDNVLTSAALVVADLMAAGVHHSREHLLALAGQVGEPAPPRRLAAPASFLARLVCGSGRQPNAYTAIGTASEFLARMPAGEREAALARMGGVTGLAREVSRARKTAAGRKARAAAKPDVLVGPVPGWSPGLSALTRAGERRVVAALVEVGGGDEPTVLIAEVPGCVRLTAAEGRALGTLERARLGVGQGMDGRGVQVAISRPVMDMVMAGAVRVEACVAAATAVAVPERRDQADDR